VGPGGVTCLAARQDGLAGRLQKSTNLEHSPLAPELSQLSALTISSNGREISSFLN
jgi:hypothetical protein